jgi:hypothetical protein
VALATDKLVFLHIPKTAGLWFRHVFKVCKIQHAEIAEQHSHFPELLRHHDQEFFKKRKIISFVRHPLTWYQSRWAFRVKHGWKSQHPLDFNCASNDFHKFVENVLRYKPDGWFTWECRMFLESTPHGVDFVGRSENLVEDTITALRLAGEKFSEKAVRSMPRINDSDMDGRPSKYWAKYTETLARRVLAVEREVIGRYYSDFAFDIQNVCGPLPY